MSAVKMRNNKSNGQDANSISSSNQTADMRIKELEKFILDGPWSPQWLSVETLLDILIVLYDECGNSTLRREKSVIDFIEWAKPFTSRIKETRLHKDDFDFLKVIGRGAFGEVAVVKMRNTDDVYAMKILNKWEMLKRAETACFREERDVLVHGNTNWITKLHYAFQDDNNLYLVMDYYVGGDLLTLLSKFEEGLPEDMARFYIAEMVLAIDSIHKLQYVHRDIKPDNVLLDVNGHIRLADFGSCLRLLPDGTVQSNIAVGTPDYISPEILQAMEDGKGRYGPECDWWSLGVCMYEMLYGETPFYAESLVETYGKIMTHKEKFRFPSGAYNREVSDAAKSLMSSLVCDSKDRLGQRGTEDFRDHPFFTGIDWENLTTMTPPYIPEYSSPTDTSNFDVDDMDSKHSSDAAPPNSSMGAFSGHHLPFIGFTYTSNSSLSDASCGSISKRSRIDNGAAGDTNEKISNASTHSLERKVHRLEQEKLNLERKLAESAKNNHNASTKVEHDQLAQSGREDESKKLKDEINLLHKKLNAADQELQAADVLRRDLEDAHQKVKALERQQRHLKQERDDTHRDLVEVKERAREQGRQLKDTHAQRKLAMEEFTEINERLTDVRTQKKKLARQLREKDEELEAATSQFKQDLRRSEKAKTSLEDQLEQKTTEVLKQTKLRELGDARVRQVEEEIEELRSKQKSMAADVPSSSHEQQIQQLQETVSRLRQDAERSDVTQREELSRKDTMHASEIKHLKVKILEAESQHVALQREIMILKDKVEKTRRENNLEQQEAIKDVKLKYEKQIKLESDNAVSLQAEVERLTLELEKSQQSVKALEEDIREGKERKEDVQQWEAQIAEIIQWVSDEKDARGYLQALAGKMTEELDTLKSTSARANTMDKWQAQRRQKVDRQAILELQSNLQSEIQAKQKISEELTRAKERNLVIENELQEANITIEELKDENVNLREKNDSTSKKQSDRRHSQLSFLNFLKDSSPSPVTHIVDNYEPTQSDMDFNIDFNQLGRLESIKSGQQHDPNQQQQQQRSQIRYKSGSMRSDSSITSEESSQNNHYEQRSRESSSIKQEIENSKAHSSSSPTRRVPSFKPIQQQVPKPKAHAFIVKTFSTPTKCNHCSSLMVGLMRQGTTCEVCEFSCHVSCASKAPAVCPIPREQSKRPKGIDPQRGIGTAYEGFVKIPKPMGVRKGWIKQLAVVCDFKLFLYDLNENRSGGGGQPGSHQPSVIVSQVIDMRDEQFEVKSVTESDVIHANKKDIPCIFSVVASCMSRPKLRTQVLMLADTESDKNKWIGAFSELHRVLRRNQLKDKSVFKPLEAYDSTLPIVKSAMSAAIIDRDRIAIGNEEGLYVIELRTDEIVKVGDAKKVHAIEVLPKAQLVAVISGRNKHVRLHTWGALDGSMHDDTAIKIEDTKACTALCSGTVRQGTTSCLCVAMKKHVNVYELNSTKTRHKKVKDIMLPNPAQWMAVFNERLCAGYVSGFALFSIQGDNSPVPLMSCDDKSLAFLTNPPVDTYCAVEITHKEYLLCFSTCGVYTDWQGRRSRQLELMWPAPPSAITYNAPYLIVYSENAVDVFDILEMEWLQTIPLKKVRPLSRDGALNLACSMDPPKLVYMKNKYDEGDELQLSELTSVGKRQYYKGKTKRRFAFKVPPEELRSSLRTELLKNPERRSQLISAPANFNHVAHMGPGDGMQILKDLPGPPPQSHTHDLISTPSNFNHVYHLGPDVMDSSLVELRRQQQQQQQQTSASVTRGASEPKMGPMYKQQSSSNSQHVSRSESSPQHRSPGSSQHPRSSSFNHRAGDQYQQHHTTVSSSSSSTTTSPDRHGPWNMSQSVQSSYNQYVSSSSVSASMATYDREDSDSRLSTASNKSSDLSLPPSPSSHPKTTYLLDSESGSWDA
uniref:serine/threonine-protein kinase MRCK alpha-like isoform X1 n=1 Tax=Styela clava TaxID=7725 RepID=UPI00193A6AB2|nr:serine/threonine-protein kinase MRCK alpha-like isoform X1 [Styela clava]